MPVQQESHKTGGEVKLDNVAYFVIDWFKNEVTTDSNEVKINLNYHLQMEHNSTVSTVNLGKP